MKILDATKILLGVSHYELFPEQTINGNNIHQMGLVDGFLEIGGS
jgi:hypothetical protein